METLEVLALASASKPSFDRNQLDGMSATFLGSAYAADSQEKRQIGLRFA
jgi:hypothetical protein